MYGSCLRCIDMLNRTNNTLTNVPPPRPAAACLRVRYLSACSPPVRLSASRPHMRRLSARPPPVRLSVVFPNRGGIGPKAGPAPKPYKIIQQMSKQNAETNVYDMSNSRYEQRILKKYHYMISQMKRSAGFPSGPPTYN